MKRAAAGSFEGDVRDLFRHIHHSGRLRRNPLVMQFFERARDRNADHVALAAIRARIMELARSCYAKDAAVGQKTRAQRRLAIVEALCANESPAATANKLGLSRSQFYRDRQAVARRVSAGLQTQEHSETARTEGLHEPLRLFIRRAVVMVDQGFGHAAVKELERLLSAATSKAARARLLMHLSAAWLSLGDYTRAADCQRTSKQLVIGVQLSNEEASVQSDLAFLLESQLAWATGRQSESRARLDDFVVCRWDKRFDSRESEELLLEVIVEACLSSCESRRMIEARSHLERAVALQRRLGNIGTDVHVDLELAAGYTSGSEHEAYWRYRSALELALRGGFAQGAAVSSVSLAGHFARRKDDGRAYEYFKRAIEIARGVEGKDTLAMIAVYGGRHLLGTKFWSVLDPMLFDVEPSLEQGTPRWMRLKENQGVVLARTGRAPEAMVALTAAEALGPKVSDRLGYTRVLCHLATLSQRLGRLAEAVDYAQSALSLADEEESTWLGSPLRVAANIVSAPTLAPTLTTPRPVRH